MVTATWANCRAEFVFDDGALVDLIAPDTGMAEWEAFWTALRSGPFRLHCYRDGEPIPLPESVAWAMAERNVASVIVAVEVGEVTANGHFFGGDLELDIDPRQVVNEAAFESVLGLMRLMASAVGLVVLASAEGSKQEHAFLSVSPNGRALYLVPRGGKHA